MEKKIKVITNKKGKKKETEEQNLENSINIKINLGDDNKKKKKEKKSKPKRKAKQIFKDKIGGAIVGGNIANTDLSRTLNDTANLNKIIEGKLNNIPQPLPQLPAPQSLPQLPAPTQPQQPQLPLNMNDLKLLIYNTGQELLNHQKLYSSQGTGTIRLSKYGKRLGRPPKDATQIPPQQQAP